MKYKPRDITIQEEHILYIENDNAVMMLMITLLHNEKSLLKAKTVPVPVGVVIPTNAVR
jgi:hypothetical protein